MDMNDADLQLFTTLGMNHDQAMVYTFLTQYGLSSAKVITLKTGINRVLVYRALDDLAKHGLVTEDHTKKVARFMATHPENLQKMADNRLNQAKNLQSAVSNAISGLLSLYNLASGKPGVRYFEGSDGIRQVLMDSLTATTEIYTYADLVTVERYFSKENAEYVKKREKLEISKKILVFDSEIARDYVARLTSTVTQIRIMPNSAHNVFASMQIYDNKISYITLSDQHLIGVIIEDTRIADMQRFIFESLYIASDNLSKIKDASDPTLS